MKLALLIVFFVIALVHLYCCYFRLETPRKITKPLLLLLLLALYCLTAKQTNHFVIAALVLGCIGDILLIFPKKEACFMAGACSFALGHVCYIHALFRFTALVSLPAERWWWSALFALPYLVMLFFIMRKLLPGVPKAKKPLLPAYIGIICIFSMGALLGMVFLETACFIPLLLGTLLFILSDTILCMEIFLKETPRGNFYVMLTYIAAQALIVWGFALAG